MSGCTASTVDVPVPRPTGTDVDAACRRLIAALPDEVDPGVTRRQVQSPARTAAWGDPPVTLECGVPAPDPADPPVVVNGVGFTIHDVGAATRWTTYGRTVRAAVTVPDRYANGVELIYPLAGPVEASLPVDRSAEPLVGTSDSPAPSPTPAASGSPAPSASPTAPGPRVSATP